MDFTKLDYNALTALAILGSKAGEEIDERDARVKAATPKENKTKEKGYTGRDIPSGAHNFAVSVDIDGIYKVGAVSFKKPTCKVPWMQFACHLLCKYGATGGNMQNIAAEAIQDFLDNGESLASGMNIKVADLEKAISAVVGALNNADPIESRGSILSVELNGEVKNTENLTAAAVD